MRIADSFGTAIAVFAATVCTAALAQTGGGASEQPMSLDRTETTTETRTETTTVTTTETKVEEEDHGGFWRYPEPAPLGKIITDRPGFSDSASLVPRGRVQFESGYTFTYDREHKNRTIDHTFPELAFRTGLTEWLEFRMAWKGWSLTESLSEIAPYNLPHSVETHDDHGTDMNVGFKVPLIHNKECWPNISMIPSMSIPTGSFTKSANNVVPELKFPWNYAVTKEFTVYGSILGRAQDGNSGQFFQGAATLAGGYQVAENVTMYCEYFGVYPAANHQDCSHVLSAGPIFRICDNVSVDMRAGLGLNEQAPDFQASVGLGVRF